MQVTVCPADEQPAGNVPMVKPAGIVSVIVLTAVVAALPVFCTAACSYSEPYYQRRTAYRLRDRERGQTLIYRRRRRAARRRVVAVHAGSPLVTVARLVTRYHCRSWWH